MYELIKEFIKPELIILIVFAVVCNKGVLLVAFADVVNVFVLGLNANIPLE